MEVYIEYVIIDNFVIDCLLAVLTLKALRLSVNKLRIIIASVFGTVAALLLPLLRINVIPLFILRVLVGAAMAFIMYNHRNVKRYFICLLMFFAVTFVFGGTVFGVMFLTGGDITAAALINYQSGVPLGLIILTICAAGFFLRQLIRFINKSKDISGFIRRAEIEVNGKSVKFDAFLDSGNQLYDKITGLPVIIVESTLLYGLIENTADNLLGNKAAQSMMKKGHYIEYSGLNGMKTKLFVFKPDKLAIYYNGQIGRASCRERV